MLKSSNGWDPKRKKKSFQASGKVKKARVIAVTYLGGKMFAHVPSVLLSDALGHEIVPLSMLASLKPKSTAHRWTAKVAFLVCLCACVFVCQGCVFSWLPL